MYGQLDVRLTDPLITHGDFIWTGNIQCDKIEHTQQTELACVLQRGKRTELECPCGRRESSKFASGAQQEGVKSSCTAVNDVDCRPRHP